MLLAGSRACREAHVTLEMVPRGLRASRGEATRRADDGVMQDKSRRLIAVTPSYMGDIEEASLCNY